MERITRQASWGSWRQRGELVRALVLRDLRLSYARSALGVLWAVAHPAALIALYAAILGDALRPGLDNQPLFLLAGLLPWIWFSGAVTVAAGVFPGNAALLRQSAFPAELLLVSTVTTQFVHFLVSLALLLPLLAVNGASHGTLVWLPILFALQGFFTLGVALVVGTGNALWRDVGHVAGVALRVWFLATPILYVSRRMPGELSRWLAMNPMTALVESYQSVLYWGRAPDPGTLGHAALASLAVMAIGWLAFATVRERLPEEV